MKIVKGLTKANASKYGIEIREDLNFTDDGSRFRGFSYKNMPMTQCVYQGECFLAIRVDYLYSKNNFTMAEWYQTEESRLADKFNGVSEFDIEDLIRTLEVIIAKVNEMNQKASVSEKEEEMILEEMDKEKEELKDFLDEIRKSEIRWWSVSSYKLKDAQRYIQDLERKMLKSSMIKRNIKSASIQEKREYLEKIKEDRKIFNYEWYMEQAREILKMK